MPLDVVAGDKCLKNQDTDEKPGGLETSISRSYERGLIVYDNQDEAKNICRGTSKDRIDSGSLIKSLRLNVTNRCNMSCAYCYVEKEVEDKEFMEWRLAKKAITDFLGLQKRHGHPKAEIRFFGGEPLLNWPVIERAIDHAESTGEGIKINYIINTNGTIMNSRISRKLSDSGVQVLISLDGIGDVNDSCRKLLSGKGSFRKIDQCIDKLLSDGAWVGIETTLHDRNYYHLKSLIDYIAVKEDEFKSSVSLYLQSVCMISKNGIDTLPVMEKVKKIIEAVKYARVKGIDSENGMLQFPYNSLLGERNAGKYCSAMGHEICVFPGGMIYPCPALKIKIGTVEDFDRVFTDKHYHRLANRMAGNIAGCRGCVIEAYCAGGCAADAAVQNGDIFNPATNCTFNRNIFMELTENFLLHR